MLTLTFGVNGPLMGGCLVSNVFDLFVGNCYWSLAKVDPPPPTSFTHCALVFNLTLFDLMAKISEVIRADFTF